MRRRRPCLFLKGKSARARRRLLLVFTLVFAPAAAERARAGCVEFSLPPAITGGADSPRDVTAADVDGDGDLDAIAVSYADGELAWFANDGEGGGWTKTTVGTTTSNLYAVAAGDVDGDGDVDLVAAGEGSGRPLALYRNLGGGATWTTFVLSTSVAYTGVVMADLDGDGDLDLAATTQVGTVRKLTNSTGGATSFAGLTVRTSTEFFRDLVAADLDADGDVDLLTAADDDDEVAWLENDGAGGTWTLVTISSTAGSARDVAVADIDGDGDLDAISAEFSPGAVAWHENTDNEGDGSTWTTHLVDTVTSGPLSAHPADLDGDGDLDLLSTNVQLGHVLWHENDGDGGTWTRHTLSTATGGPDPVTAADLDGDGDLDPMVGFTTGDSVTWFRNERLHDTALFGDFTVVPWTGTGSPYRVIGADLDRDGDPDLVSSRPDDVGLHWFVNQGPGAGFDPQEVSATSDALALAAADLDGDGDLDLLTNSAYSSTDGVFWHSNNGGGGGWTMQTIYDAEGGVAVAAADLDSDGDLDALAVFSDGQVAWFENSGTGGGWTPHGIGTGDAPFWVEAADLDRDGDLDVLFAALVDHAVFWRENRNGLGTLWSAHTVAEWFSTATTDDRPTVARAADIDGDGDLDALVARYSAAEIDTLAWFENDGTPAGDVWAEHPISTVPRRPFAAAVADVDGDGDLDVLSGSMSSYAEDHLVSWHENDGEGGGWTLHALEPVPEPYSIVVTDLDVDGDLDAAAVDFDAGELVWYENLGTGIFDDGFDAQGSLAAPACWSSPPP